MWISLWIIFMKARWNPRQLLDPMSPQLSTSYGNFVFNDTMSQVLFAFPSTVQCSIISFGKKRLTQLKRHPNRFWDIELVQRATICCSFAERPVNLLNPQVKAKGTTCFPTTNARESEGRKEQNLSTSKEKNIWTKKETIKIFYNNILWKKCRKCIRSILIII